MRSTVSEKDANVREKLPPDTGTDSVLGKTLRGSSSEFLSSGLPEVRTVAWSRSAAGSAPATETEAVLGTAPGLATKRTTSPDARSRPATA